MNSIIRVTNFEKQYTNHLVSLDDLHITKRVNLLIGKNGSGKSTLLKAIAKLIKHSGEINVNNKTCYMCESVSYPRDIDLETFLKQLYAISSQTISEEDKDSLLENFNLNNKLNKSLHSLSKGMKAKVNLVQCLMEEADIYLLDEPLSGLDELGIEYLVKYISNSEKTFVISTHLASDFSETCDEMFYL